MATTAAPISAAERDALVAASNDAYVEEMREPRLRYRDARVAAKAAHDAGVDDFKGVYGEVTVETFIDRLQALRDAWERAQREAYAAFQERDQAAHRRREAAVKAAWARFRGEEA